MRVIEWKMRLAVARYVALVLAGIALVLGLAGQVSAQSGPTRQVLVVDVDGPINSITERLVRRALDTAARDGAALLVLRVDTPGGLFDSTRHIVGMLLDSPVPTAAIVAPAGAHAASAGTFVVAAAHFAAMTPGTNIGAATPVSGGGDDFPKTLAEKVTNDAAALMREIAEQRGRNVAQLEATIRSAHSFSAREAVDSAVVDLLVNDVDSLLDAIDGEIIVVRGTDVILSVRGLPVHRFDQTLLERFLSILANPNVSFLLLSLGSLAIVVELWNPGMLIPGVVGGILLVLAFLGLGNLPANWAGVALILFAGGLAIAESYVAGFGVLGGGALISFVLGAFLLFGDFGQPSPTDADVSISWWVLFPTIVVLFGGGSVTMQVIKRASQSRPEDLVHPALGAIGHVVSTIGPRGSVHVGGEDWTAVSAHGEVIERGNQVRVVAVDRTVLSVEPREESRS